MEYCWAMRECGSQVKNIIYMISLRFQKGVLMFAKVNTLKRKAGILILSIIFITTFLFERTAGADCTSCDGCPPPTLGYTSKQMSAGGQQTLIASGGYGSFQWNKSGGGGLGTATGDRSQNIVYSASAPFSNPNCSNNPTITVTDSCGRVANAAFAVNTLSSDVPALVATAEARAGCNSGGNFGNCWYVNARHYCDGSVWGGEVCGNADAEQCPTGGPGEMEAFFIRKCEEACDNCQLCQVWPCQYCECAPGGTPLHDIRDDRAAQGCCPFRLLSCVAAINNFLDRPPINASGGEGITITALITYESGTSGSWTLTIEGTGRTFQGSGVNVSEYWNGRNSENKLVDPGKHTARLDVQVAGGQCQNGTETKTAQIEVSNIACQNQESGTCKPVFSVVVPTEP
jgi:hypothetical protein